MFSSFLTSVLVMMGVVCIAMTDAALITTECDFYNHTSCTATGEGCNGTQLCKAPEVNERNYCYVLWQNNSTGQPQVKLKGCFVNGMDCYNMSRCVGTREEPKKNLLFCCCVGDFCNREFSWEPVTTEATVVSVPALKSSQERPILNIFMWTLVPIMAIVVMSATAYWAYRRHKMAFFNELPTNEPLTVQPPSPMLTLTPVQLIEIKARGRYGAVWKGQLKKETVAVKIFPLQDKQSWLAEQEVFKLPQMDVDNILHFICAEKRGDNLQTEFWLITAFHEKGSLCDYLKSNTVTWPELCRIAESMARGLTYLHEELPPTKSEGCKPSVAHRDFKSKNVLLKSDLTACVADFGLALIFYPGRPVGDTHGQVGTRRYMAPEVLEGAINFNRDAFLRIDMYACALVLWEIVTRCRAQDGPVPEYLLPFEEEVGQHPTLEDMQECVVHLKRRPLLKETWRQHPGLQVLCHTIEECWDQDAEARLSASCVLERLSTLLRQVSIRIPPVSEPLIPGLQMQQRESSM